MTTGSFIDDLAGIPGLNQFPAAKDRGLVTAEEAAEAVDGEMDEPKKERPTYPCESCGGTGRYRGVRLHQAETRCFACGGRGFFFMSYKDRMDKRQKAKSRKADKAAAAVAEYTAAHPEAIAWLKTKAEAGRFTFAVSVWAAFQKYGHLTDGQLAAAERFMAADAERAKVRAEELATASASANAILTPSSVDNLMASLKKAEANGLKKPALRFEGFTVTMAGAASKNAGGLYLKNEGVYLGKIVDGKLTSSWEAKNVAGLLDRIAEAMVDPVAAAIAYGKRSGRCSCCGRTLTDPVSVERGIGPICESNFF